MMRQLPLFGMPGPSPMPQWPARLQIPHWDQLADPDVGAVEPDPASTTDCGEECVSMVVNACTGAYTTEGQIRRLMGKSPVNGASSSADLIEALRSLAVLSHLYSDAGRLHVDVKDHLQQRRPAILLGRYVSPAELHWIVAIGYGNGMLHFNDPWRGVVRAMTWSWVLHWSGGEVVMVDHECKVIAPKP